MTTTVTRIYRFEASHALPKGYGKSSRPHGHSYTLEIECPRGQPTEALDAWWATACGSFDHRDLNETFPDTTVEALAEAIYASVYKYGLPVISVRLREGDLRYATALS